MSKARIAITWLVATALLAGAGITTAVIATAAPAIYTVTAGELNVRSGPSTSTKTLYTLKKGAALEAKGKAAKGWQPIQFNGTTAYVYAKYVKVAKKNTTPITSNVPATRKTSANVNLRTAPDLDSEIIRVIKKGAAVAATGRSRDGFTEVKVDGKVRWLYTKYVGATTTAAPKPTTPAKPASPTVPDSVANVSTVSTLSLRSDASPSAKLLGNIEPDTTVGLTGKHSGSYSQVVIDKVVAWVLTGYLAAVKSGPTVTLPASVGLRYINATDVNVRKAADVESTKLATLPRGSVLQATGPEKNQYTQIIYNGGLAWVASQYLSTTPPGASLGSSSLDKLKQNAKDAVLVVRDEFPEIKSMYGWRASSAYSSDHPNGRAIDIMIPSYKKNKALGDRIAKYFIDNNKSLKVKYVIWRQRNFTITRGKWVHMADRGGDTANHFDHVHVSFLS